MSVFYAGCTLGAAVASAGAVEAAGVARGAKSKVEELEARLDRALLACEAMWTIIRDKLEVTEVELLNRINDVDLSDGRLDGKVRKTAVTCPSCGRTISQRFAKCMYCGQVIVHDPFA